MGTQRHAEIEADIGRHLDAGDHAAAAAAMIRGFGVEILGYLATVTRDPVLAEDVFATVGFDLWRGLPGFRREASARTWLYRLAWHALQRHRADPFALRRTALEPVLERVVHEVRSSTAPFLRTEVKDAVARLRERLDPEEQTLLILRVDRGLSWREVSEIMSQEAPLGEAQLRKRFERIKARLRRLAEQAGLLQEE